MKKAVLAACILLLLQPAFAQTHTFTVTQGANGTISPSGAVPVNDGDTITFTITPDPGYVVADIQTSGVSQGRAGKFKQIRVATDEQITAIFLPEANLVPETIYVDGALATDCLAGNYSITNQDCSGSDGDAYTSITEASNVAGQGDTVLIRGGTYNKGTGEVDVLWPKHSGTAENPITFKAFPGEQVVLGQGTSRLSTK